MNYYLQAFDKLENLLKILDRIYESRINIKYPLRIPNKFEEIKRACELNFVYNSLGFFIRRSWFILKNLKCDLLEDKELEILRTIFRGFIEILARFYYLEKNKYKFSLNYLWEAVFTSIYAREINKKGLEVFYNLLKYIQIVPSIPDLDTLEKLFLKYKNDPFSEDDDIKMFKKLNRECSYSSVYSLLKNYCDNLDKRCYLYNWYEIFSKQIHASPFYEGFTDSSISFKHQILGLLLRLIQEFIPMVSKYFSENEIKKIDEVTKELLKIEIKFKKEWRMASKYNQN